MTAAAQALLQRSLLWSYDGQTPVPILGRVIQVEAPQVAEESRGEGKPAGIQAEATLSLVQRAKAGDEAALQHLCARYLPRLHRWASGRLPGYARDLLATDDLVQDVLFQTVRRIEGFRSEREGAFQVYLRQVLMNRIRDQVRRPHIMQALTDAPEMAAQAASPLEELVGERTMERYERALTRLSPEDREAVVARIEMAGTYQELAEVLGKPSADAARMAVGRALVRLAKEMGHES
jgi:RNA polymerase sigma-70 factor (ECF subfamily)